MVRSMGPGMFVYKRELIQLAGGGVAIQDSRGLKGSSLVGAVVGVSA